MKKLIQYRRLVAVGVVGLIALILEFILQMPSIAQIVVTILGSIITILMVIDMVKTIRSGNFGVDLLAITAIVATMAIGEYWAALIVLLMLVGGDALEDYAATKANSDLQALLEKAPRKAHLLNEKQEITDVEINEVEIGHRILVKPGEVVPIDGHIIEGSSLVDEASITGESKPIDKKVNDEILSGVVNGESALTIEADKIAEDSQYQGIIKLVKQAESQPAHFVRMADQYAIPFTILAYVIAGTAWYLSGDPVRFAEVLVVASPCPLILAAPIALVAGMSKASVSGVIVKSGTTLEKLAKIKTMAFDKTGTITQGNLQIKDVLPVAGTSEKELLFLTAAVEQHSNHILAQSVVDAVSEELPSVTDMTEIPGKGIQGTVNGQLVQAGNAKLVDNEQVKQIQDTAIYVAIDGKYIGCITFADEVRTEAKETMSELKDLGIKNLVMISGDRKAIADKIANLVGITQVFAERLPAEKIKVLNEIPSTQHPIAMVGDGVNDAPSLVIADVGIAMGKSGATAASESADAVILNDDLAKIPAVIQISKYTMKIARQAVLIGILICTILMLIASVGVIPVIFGAMLQELVDTVTILYALRAKGS
ncbi:heavy metal translocating P-type ATPase [Paucilactobacillus nenjiangensis]|uniref:heavy metal translocating P-type ATPase n=1 Tax=Paucilactobacillus nenjiangensis TaxID=1296540 RepID=UPI003BAE26F7